MYRSCKRCCQRNNLLQTDVHVGLNQSLAKCEKCPTSCWIIAMLNDRKESVATGVSDERLRLWLAKLVSWRVLSRIRSKKRPSVDYRGSNAFPGADDTDSKHPCLPGSIHEPIHLLVAGIMHNILPVHSLRFISVKSQEFLHQLQRSSLTANTVCSISAGRDIGILCFFCRNFLIDVEV